MAIPDFQSLMLPMLKLCADGQKHTNREVLESLARDFGLTEQERKVLLPSGQARTFDNRVAWARAHMKMAGLLENTERGVFRVTERGQSVLQSNPKSIDLAFLRTFPEYLVARGKPKEKKVQEKSTDVGNSDSQTPAEQLENAYQTLRDTLSEEILEQLKAGSAAFFERVVVDVLVKMGYGGSLKDAGQAIGSSGDEGIDGIIKEDRLGLDIIYVQAKKWIDPVPRPEVQKFAGALQGKRAKKGIFITTSRFTDGATEFAGNLESKIILIDGEQLAQYMMDFGVGVSTEAVYEIKRLDSDYFTGEQAGP